MEKVIEEFDESKLIDEMEKGVAGVLERLRTDCAFCKEKAELYLREQNNRFLTLAPLDFDFMLRTYWDCPICGISVNANDVLPLSKEEAEVKKYEDMGHLVEWHPEYDAYLNYTLEKKIGMEDCGDENCEFCSHEIDWKKIKKEYADKMAYYEELDKEEY